MEYYKNRLRAFDTYPKQMLPDKFQLARAGLLYTAKSDICQGFRYYVKLSSSEIDDDAIKDMMKTLDPKVFQTWRELRNDVM